jgi:mono/diheme cytochrome c family protein
MRNPLIAAGLIAAVLVGCSEEKHERGLEALPDMFHTPAHKALTAITSPDGKTEYSSMLPPVEGTVQRGYVPYAIAPTDWPAAKLLQNPLTPSRDVLRLGQTWFNHTCAMCHGRDGNAQHANIAKQFAGVPSINGVNVLGMADGEIYHIITVGRNRMPRLVHQLPPTERWSVVTYVKVLARATIAATKASDVVADAEAVIHAELPTDPAAKAKMEEDRSILARRQADLDAILALGDRQDEAAAAFAPLPEPIPEYIPPTWNVPGGAQAGAEKH